MLSLLNYPGTLALYSSVFFTAWLLARLAQNNDLLGKKVEVRLWLFLLILLLSLFSGFRGKSVGIDTAQYAADFANTYYSKKMSREILFYLISRLVVKFFGETQAAFVFWAFIINFFIIKRLWCFRSDASFSFMVLSYCMCWYLMTFSGIRQWAAVAIMFYYSKVLFDEGRVFRFSLIALLCTFIHLSAFFSLGYILFYFTSQQLTENERNRANIAIFIGIPSLMLLLYLFNISFNVFEQYAYIFSQNAINEIGLMVPALLLTLLLINRYKKAYYPEEYLLNKNCSIYTLCRIEFLSLIIQTLGYFLKNTARLRWGFSIFEPVLYGTVFSPRNRGKFSLAKVLIVITMVYTFLSSGSSKFAPFVFYWER